MVLPAILVAVGIPFRRHLGLRSFQDTSVIRHYDLPHWLLWLQNPEDGLTGDKRGWYWNVKTRGWPDWLKMWWWSGVRNPWNYFKRITIGCDVRNHSIVKVYGDDYVRDDLVNTGFQILLAKGSGIPKPALYWVKRYGQSNRAIVVQLGWKLKLEHNNIQYEDPLDYYKGLTFEINPFKDVS